MSDLQRLKGQLNSLASDTRGTAGGLQGFKKRFSTAVGQVQSTIGGTATNTDKQIIQTLQAAERQLDQAIQALQQAAKSAQEYSSRL